MYVVEYTHENGKKLYHSYDGETDVKDSMHMSFDEAQNTAARAQSYVSSPYYREGSPVVEVRVRPLEEVTNAETI